MFYLFSTEQARSIEVQLLQNMAAKIILDVPKQSSSSLALECLKWKHLKERRLFRRSPFVFKVFNKMIDFQLDNICNSQVHSYETRLRNNRVLPIWKTNWGQCRSNIDTCICTQNMFTYVGF